MKVVILDDEEKVCNLIRALIDWDSLNLELVGTASDGLSGKDLILKAAPDILITDIRMPGIDGLQVIAEAKKELPLLQVIIISGYGQFDYAQTAIKYGVVDYLLKPINKQELNNTLKKMIEEFNLREKETSKTKQIEEQVKKSLLQKQKDAILYAAFNKDTDILDKLQIQPPAQIYLIQFDITTPSYDKQSSDILAKRLESFISELITEHHIFIFNETYCLLVVANKSESDDYAKKIFAWCKTQTELFRNFYITISSGKTIKNGSDFFDAAQLCSQGNLKRFVEGVQTIYKETSLLTPVHFDCLPYIKNIFIAIMQNKKEDFIFIYQDLKKRILDEISYAPQYVPIVADFYYSIIDEAAIHLGKKANEEILNMVATIQSVPKIELFWEKVFSLLDFIYEEIVAANKEKYVKPVQKAQKYIAAHYNNSQLSLNGIADYVGLNSSYFSDLFKKTCSIGFSEYIQNIRIEHAKDLLVNTKQQIKQIAESVGYADPKHFAKVFKNHTGIKPNEYRRLYE